MHADQELLAQPSSSLPLLFLPPFLTRSLAALHAERDRDDASQRHEAQQVADALGLDGPGAVHWVRLRDTLTAIDAARGLDPPPGATTLIRRKILKQVGAWAWLHSPGLLNNCHP